VERARAFYRDVLGLEPVRDNHGHLFYECGGSSFLVFPSTGSPSGTHDQLGFAVDDVEAAAATLRDRGVELEAYEAPPGCTFRDGIMDYGPVRPRGSRTARATSSPSRSSSADRLAR
jgi:catechol 2,3-dioxygenase-like lactoylglutathione lyase family enzyme